MGDGGASENRRQARRGIEQATGVLGESRERFLSDPLYLEALRQATGLMEDPLSLSPEVVAALEQNAAASAHAAARNQLAEGLGRLSTTSGLRGGAARNLQGQIAQGLGQAIAEGSRNARIAAAQQRIPDIVNALQASQGLLQQQYAMDNALANAHMGGAQISASLPTSPSFLQGVGGLAGNVLGAAGAAGGFAKLFG